MAKFSFSQSQNMVSGLFQSRLSRQVTTWVFLSIITIEGIIFIPAYSRRQDEQLRKLESVSQEVLNGVKVGMMNDMPEKDLLTSVQLREDSIIKGVALYNAQGQLVDSRGESPAFDTETFTQLAEPSFWQRIGLTNEPAMNVVRTLSRQGSRYDVAWPNPQATYTLAIRHDATSVRQGMRMYVLGISILVVIISAFVTLVTLAVIERIVIRPLLLLRDDLSAVGEAITQNQTPSFASLERISTNELGDVAVAFQGMFNRIQQEISDREEAEADLRREQEKADRLLRNILPETIAAQLKDNLSNRGAIANRFDTATILFADIVNFTNIAAQTGPTQLVCQLNDIFSAFDAIAERHNLEKIKTIGDAYMVVGGVPSPNKKHAQAVMAMAIEMMEFAQDYPMGEKCLCLRIGINTGPVVAGVIGTKKFSYDLWGDAVNIASRMESHGLVNRIQVSEETYLQLKELYTFEDRGYLPIKGRGEMRVFLLAESKDSV